MFNEVVHWRKRLFKLPTGSSGKEFVRLISTQIRKYVDSSGDDESALYNMSILPVLLLQMTRRKCSAKDNVSHLTRRMSLWNNGDVSSLLEEGRCLQNILFRPKRGGRKQGQEDQARHFADLMSLGKVHDALRMLGSDFEDAGIHKMDDVVTMKDGSSATVRDLLLQKHPEAASASSDVLLPGDPTCVNAVRFDSITPEHVKSVAMHSEGSAGPSGLDASCWRRMCSAFKGASSHLCEAMADFTRLLATRVMPPGPLVPFLAGRLIALDKKPGVRPIGVGEVLRRIVAKAVLRVAKEDVMKACGHLQKCSGLPAGIEAAVHAMQHIYNEDTTEAVLLVDAANAFNSLNREVALHNVQRLCPPLSSILRNSYQSPARLFVAGGGEIASREGTTQGDPLSMAFYALATVPLISHLQRSCQHVKQGWYADDSGGAGRLGHVRDWWDRLQNGGTAYGYHTNSDKILLLVKPSLVAEASQIFSGTGIRVVTGCTKYLGSVIGETEPIKEHLQTRVIEWSDELKRLVEIAKTEPHAAYAALIHGLRGRWIYLLRTSSVSGDCLASLDHIIQTEFLPTISGRDAFTPDDLAMLRLPTRLGGAAIPSLRRISNQEYDSSKAVTAAQVEEIIHQNDISWVGQQPESIAEEARAVKRRITQQRRSDDQTEFLRLKRSGSSRLEQLAVPGVSNWLTVLPLKEHGYHLSKGDFRDALALRYDWALQDVPLYCACGKEFSVTHAMCCATGGFPTVRHNEVRDMMADLVTEVCSDVAVEPLLAPVTGEVFCAASTNTAPDARADIRARGFWTRAQNAFFDIRVFHPDAESYRNRGIDQLLLQHESRKKLEYAERIVHVDRGTFTPLVFSTAGCAAPECLRFLKRLCGLLSAGEKKSYSEMMSYVRCRLSLALLRMAVMCVRGSRSSYHRPVNALREVALAEGRHWRQ